ncbi:unnamed protein product, partial [marine sediment metagenome]
LLTSWDIDNYHRQQALQSVDNITSSEEIEELIRELEQKRKLIE